MQKDSKWNIRSEDIGTQHYLTKVEIEKLRHLSNITIGLNDNHRQHLLLTGDLMNTQKQIYLLKVEQIHLWRIY